MAISRAAMRRHRRGARSRGRPDAGRAIAGGWRTAARASLQHAVGGEDPDQRRFPLITGAASRALRAWPHLRSTACRARDTHLIAGWGCRSGTRRCSLPGSRQPMRCRMCQARQIA